MRIRSFFFIRVLIFNGTFPYSYNNKRKRCIEFEKVFNLLKVKVLTFLQTMNLKNEMKYIQTVLKSSIPEMKDSHITK